MEEINLTKMGKYLIILGVFIGFNASGQQFGAGVTDIDGNFYETVIIGTQEWTSENLQSETYANGDPITNVSDNNQWNLQTEGAWSYYDNDSIYNEDYGKLYNWYAASDSRNICPDGWHVPDTADWRILTDNYGGHMLAGNALKESGSLHWPAANGGTNISGFTALPGGIRDTVGGCSGIGMGGSYQSSVKTLGAWNMYFFGNATTAELNFTDLRVGNSARCVRTAPTSSIEESSINPNRKLLKIIDLLGREVETTDQKILLYLYDDGSTKKVLQLE